MASEGNNNQLGNDRIESLRLILERKQHREITYAEAADIGSSLVGFFKVLAEDNKDYTENVNVEAY